MPLEEDLHIETLGAIMLEVALLDICSLGSHSTIKWATLTGSEFAVQGSV
jgi:hypothetical protein